MTIAIPVLHKFTSTPSPLVFTPTTHFKCSHLILWFSKSILIKDIIVGKDNQLAQSLSGQIFAAPATLNIIEQWFKDYVLPTMAVTHTSMKHELWPFKLSMADSHRPITIEFEGEFDMLALYGAELHE